MESLKKQTARYKRNFQIIFAVISQETKTIVQIQSVRTLLIHLLINVLENRVVTLIC